MALWETMAAARYAAEAPLGSGFLLDMLHRDVALWTVPVIVHVDSATYTTTGAWTTAFAVVVCFPSSWDNDPSDGNVALLLNMNLYVAAISSGETLELRINGCDPSYELTLADTDDPCDVGLKRDWKANDTLPTGATSFDVQYRITGLSPTISFGMPESRGAISYYQFGTL